jgi:pyridoxamine 5'-phosphate oxidase
VTAPDPDAGRGGEPLDERDCPEDPLVLFGRWHRTAVAARVPEPDAMTLATVSEEGTAAARIVLLRAFGAGGFVFLTDAASRKGRELARVAHAALAFHWAALERQVRVEGEVVTLDGNASDELFAAGPRATRIALSAWTQSAQVADRADAGRNLDPLGRHAEHFAQPGQIDEI